MGIDIPRLKDAPGAGGLCRPALRWCGQRSM
jgi:hypothetical protein